MNEERCDCVLSIRGGTRCRLHRNEDLDPPPFDLRAFRERWPFKPHQLAVLDGERTVEVISYPWPDNERAAINIRLAPGDPCTMITVGAERLGVL